MDSENETRIWWEKIDNYLVDISLDYDLTVRDMINFFSYKLSSELGKHEAEAEDVKCILSMIFERYTMFKKNINKRKTDEME